MADEFDVTLSGNHVFVFVKTCSMGPFSTSMKHGQRVVGLLVVSPKHVAGSLCPSELIQREPRGDARRVMLPMHEAPTELRRKKRTPFLRLP